MSAVGMYLEKAKDTNYNLGHLFMDIMREKPPEGICQIDAAINKSETNASVLSRSVQLAKCFRKFGLKPGDILALGGNNHLDLHIPYYAAIFNGLPIVGVDPYYKYDEIKHLFKLTEPKIAFCQNETREFYERAAREIGIDVKIVTFDGDGDTLSKFMECYQETADIDDFQVAEFNTDKIYGWLVSTSGTTGLPKVAAFTHHQLIQQILYFAGAAMYPSHTTNLALNLAPVQWISGYFHAFAMPLMNLCKLQTSSPDDIEHIIDIINRYKPITMMSSPSTISSILQHEKPCDLTCFKILTLAGSKVYKELILEVKSRIAPECLLMDAYGQTETLGPSLRPNPLGPLGSCGVPLPAAVRKIKLVHPDTGDEVTEPNVPGELWTKGPLFSEYYKNPVETAKAFTQDGWYKTGDLLYRDENDNYFFVDRIKTMIKYRNHQIAPMELEQVIGQLPQVAEVCVVGAPHAADGQRAAACVVRRAGTSLAAGTIHDLVASKLSPSKQLRGGIIFLDKLPKTSTGKMARAQIVDIVINGSRDQLDS